MAMSRWSVNLTALFWGRLRLGSTLCTRFACNWQYPFLNHWKKENDDRKYFMTNLHQSIGPGSNSRSLYQQSNSLPIALQGQVILGFLFYLNWPWIQFLPYLIVLEPYYMNYWLLGSLTWSVSQVHMRHSQGFFCEQGKMAFISGEQRKKQRGTETILGNRENKTTPSLRGLRISLRRQNTTKVWHTILLEIRHCNTSNDVQTNASA